MLSGSRQKLVSMNGQYIAAANCSNIKNHSSIIELLFAINSVLGSSVSGYPQVFILGYDWCILKMFCADSKARIHPFVTAPTLPTGIVNRLGKALHIWHTIKPSSDAF